MVLFIIIDIKIFCLFKWFEIIFLYWEGVFLINFNGKTKVWEKDKINQDNYKWGRGG